MTDEENIDSAIDKAYEKLCLVDIVTSDLFITETEGADLKNAWLRLLLCGEFGVETQHAGRDRCQFPQALDK